MPAKIFRENDRVIVQLSGVSADRGRYARIELDILKVVGWMTTSAYIPEIDGFRIFKDERFPTSRMRM